MSCRPGDFRITDQAMEIWQLPAGAAVLDIGCGLGETLEYLTEKFGYKASGIDISRETVDAALDRNPGLDVKYGDGEFLDGYQSYTFDGVMMECVLSLINIPDEALHEAYCVLKKGGLLYLSDLYIKDPEPGFIRELHAEPAKQKNQMPRDSSCSSECAEEHKKKTVDFRHDGKFLVGQLVAQLEEIGYTDISWKDCSLELDNYMAERIMQDGTLEGCCCDKNIMADPVHKTGYFMLTARKP